MLIVGEWYVLLARKRSSERIAMELIIRMITATFVSISFTSGGGGGVRGPNTLAFLTPTYP